MNAKKTNTVIVVDITRDREVSVDVTISGGELFKDVKTMAEGRGYKRGNSSRSERGKSTGDDVTSSSSNCIMGGVAPPREQTLLLGSGWAGRTSNINIIRLGRT